MFDVGMNHDYFNEPDYYARCNNERVFKKIADKSFRPMNSLLERLLARYPDFKFSISVTGVFIEQAEKWAPDVLDSFKRLVATGRVEVVAETYHHSLAFFYSRREFEAQVAMHQQKVKQVFGVDTSVYRNTELSYNNDLARWAHEYGFKGILAEGWDPILEWRSPNHVYRPDGVSGTKLLLKNYRLSDDIAFRFSDKAWPQWPLTVDKYLDWVNTATLNGPLINLFMDYETFGEHQWEDTGIFDFFEQFIGRWSDQPGSDFLTVSGATEAHEPVAEISMPATVSWADTERDLSAWLGNSMQHDAMRQIYALEDDIIATGDLSLIDDWRKLQTSDHVYYMCTKYFNDGDVHAYFNAYDSPYDACLYYMNALRDIRYRLSEKLQNG
jgi:alpha-amylase